jgi:molybdopterin synthase catalytic subunit
MVSSTSFQTQLVDQAIDHASLISWATRPECGAVLLFLGVTREWTDGERTTQLEYDAYRTMALRELEQLAEQAANQWPLEAVAITHRLGIVPIGEASVAIVVGSAHRQAAFEAGQWLIDRLKERVPIWKKDYSPDGSDHWMPPNLGGFSQS